MEIAWPFLVYALMFRLAVIAAGALSVYYGYRLFFAAAQAKSSDRGSSLEAGMHQHDREEPRGFDTLIVGCTYRLHTGREMFPQLR